MTKRPGVTTEWTARMGDGGAYGVGVIPRMLSRRPADKGPVEGHTLGRTLEYSGMVWNNLE